MKQIFIIVTVILFFTGNIAAQNVVWAGALTGSGNTLKSAFDAVNAGGGSGIVTVTIQGNTTELATAQLNQTNYTVNVGVSGASRIVSGALTAPVVSFAGADNVTIEGRIGGTGSTRSLTVKNTSNTIGAQTVAFSGGAQSNTIQWCNIIGINSSTATLTQGIIIFLAGASIANPNTGNVIQNCDISGNNGGAAFSTILINSSSATGTNTAQIKNNNLSNNFAASGAITAVNLAGGNTAWNIEGNNYYQTADRDATSATFTFFTATSGTGYTVKNNIIGGNGAGGNMRINQTSIAAAKVRWLYCNLSANTNSMTFTGNLVNNIQFRTSSGGSTSAPGIWTFLSINVGICTVGGPTVADANTFGGNINISSTGTSLSNSFGICSESAANHGKITIQKNTIAGITVNGSGGSTNNSMGFYAVWMAGGSANEYEITDNTIGSSVIANSIVVSSAATSVNASTSQGDLIGIYIASAYTGSNNCIVSRNVIANLSHTCTYTNSGTPLAGAPQGPVRGIKINTGSSNSLKLACDNNQIFNISHAQPFSGTGSSSSVIGIQVNATGASTSQAYSFSNNKIYSLTNTAATGTPQVTGIYFSGPTGGGLIEKTFIHSLSTNNSVTGGTINGVQLVLGSNLQIRNNMIRLGISNAGAAVSAPLTINGIIHSGGSNENFVHNTIYIGGTNVSSVTNTNSYALHFATTAATSNYRNNIFINARSNSTAAAGSKHYAYRLNSAGFTSSNYNLIKATGTNGAVLGQYIATDYTTVGAFSSASSSDANSFEYDPPFISATGNATTVNLHIDSTSLLACGMKAKGQAPLTPAVLTDYDDETRSTSTPDVGADEFNKDGTFWLGGTPGFLNDWNTAANWCSNTVPVAGTNVIIPNGVVNYPIITVGGGSTALANNITIGTTASIIINAAGVMAASGSFINNGSFTNNGLITLTGTSLAQSFPGAAGTISAMNEITINNTSGINPAVTINKDFVLTGTITPTSGIIDLGNSTVTIRSDNTSGTARVAEVQAAAGFTYSGTGKFVIERYIRAKRAWRLLTSPVTAVSGQTIKASWQENAIKNPMGTATVASDPFPGYGTHISGGSAVNGYDANTTGNASVKIFNAITDQWENMPVSTSLLAKKVTDERGYMLFVRGSRGLDLTNGTAVVPDNTTLRTNGQLNIHPVLAPLTISGAGLTVVGNPFASAIDFDVIASLSGLTNAQKVYYLWDPSINGIKNVGGWVTLAYNSGTGRYDRTVVTTNDYTSVTPGDQGIDDEGTIQSGAAFMMDFTGFGSITIDETVKKSGSTNLVYRPAQQVRTNLYSVHNSGASLTDAVLVTFNAANSNAADEYDVKKINNFSENFSLKRAGSVLAIERRKPLADNDSIFYQLTQMGERSYQFEFIPDSIVAEPGLVGFLEDTYLQTSTLVSLTDTTRVSFSITSDMFSADPDRFRLVFKNIGGPLPVMFLSLQAWQQQADIVVEWKMEQASGISKYEVEKSTDGINFTILHTVNAVANDNAIYQCPDVNAAAGDHFYRIRIVNRNGSAQYSRIVKVTIGNSNKEITLYPNPVIDKTFGLQFSNLPAGIYDLLLTNAAGQVVQKDRVLHAGGNASKTIRANNNIVPGSYLMQLLNGKSITKIRVLVLR